MRSREGKTIPRTATVVRSADRRVVCERCAVAATPLARMRGLLGRRSLPRGEGLFLRPASSIHMAFMRFPIDAVFLDGDGEVVKIAARLQPWRVAGARRAKAVIELPAGECEARGLAEGDRLVLESPSRA